MLGVLTPETRLTTIGIPTVQHNSNRGLRWPNIGEPHDLQVFSILGVVFWLRRALCNIHQSSCARR